MPAIIFASLAAHFYRVGRKWTKEGVVVDIDEFTEGEWGILRSEKNLLCREATKEEIALRDGEVALGVAPPTFDEIVIDLIAVIPGLVDAEFTKEGQPRMGALRKAVSIDGDLVTKDTVAAAMKILTEGGFKPPAVD